MRELIARIRAVMRRSDTSASDGDGHGHGQGHDAPSGHSTDEQNRNSRIQTVGTLVIDLRTHRVTLDGDELMLTTKEFGVLAMLSSDPGAVVTRSDLIEHVWDEHWYGPTKTLDVHVAQLRRKLGNAGWIENVRSVGYRLVNPQDDPGK